MTSSFQENVKMYLLSQAVTLDTASPKNGIWIIRVNYILKILTLKILLFCFNFMDYYFTF